MVKVLFLCVHNSARSQIAEAYLKKFGDGKFEVESAGLEPGKLSPPAVEIMKEDGIDISGNSVNDVFEFFKEGRFYTHVITVCDDVNSEKCPIFPGTLKKMSWNFPDPSKQSGSSEEVKMKMRQIRDSIKEAVMKFIAETGKEE